MLISYDWAWFFAYLQPPLQSCLSGYDQASNRTLLCALLSNSVLTAPLLYRETSIAFTQERCLCPWKNLQTVQTPAPCCSEIHTTNRRESSCGLWLPSLRKSFVTIQSTLQKTSYEAPFRWYFSWISAHVQHVYENVTVFFSNLCCHIDLTNRPWHDEKPSKKAKVW